MIKVIATKYIPAGRYAEYVEMVRELVELTRAEQGCISYELCGDESRSLCLMVETWQDAQYLAAHAQNLIDSGWRQKLDSFSDPNRPNSVEKFSLIY